MTRLFRKQLTIAILPVLLLAALSTLWTTSVSERQMVAQLKAGLVAESELHVAGVRSFLDERLAELRTIAAAPIVRGNDPDAIVPYLRSESERLKHHFEGLYYNDLQGNVRGTHGEEFSNAARDYFPRLRNGDTIVTDEIASLATGHPIILMAVPFYDDNGQHRGAICASIQVSTLSERVRSVVLPEVGFATLIDSHDRILTPKRAAVSDRRHDFEEWLDRGEYREPPRDAVAERPSSHKATFAGEDYFVAQRPVPGTGWHYFLAKRASLASGPAVSARWANLLFSGLVLVIAFLVAYYFTGKFLGPLAELVDVHRRFGQGDYQVRAVNMPDDELGELGQAFNRTAEQLAQRQAAQMVAENQLRESEAKFRQISDNVDDAIVLHDVDGRIISVNQAACESLGYQNDELVHRSVLDVVAEPDAEGMRHVWRTIHQRCEKVRLEGTHRRRDGSTFPVEMLAVPLQTQHGLRILVSARDISERRRAENKMTKFFQLSEDMMCMVDAQGYFRQLSPAFEQVLGFSRHEMLDKPYLDFVHPGDREHTQQESVKVFEGRRGISFENRCLCKDGGYKWLQWRPFLEVEEGIAYAIARDVTESHRLTRLMQQTSAAANIGGWEIDFLTGELFWTEETFRLHDLDPEEYRPSLDTAIAFYELDSQEKVRRAIAEAMSEGKTWNFELRLITAKGRLIWAHAIGRVDCENGKPIRAYGSFQDITERKQAEDERREIDKQLREIQRVESIGILAGGIAHDFNNLLTGVLGFTRLALTEATAGGHESIVSHLQQIENCSLRAADLCKQLLAYAGKGKFVIETIDLSALVRDTAGLINSIVSSHAKLEFDLDEHLPLIEGDATQLRQVVMNLVHNAFDALDGKAGTVQVRTGLRHCSRTQLQAINAHNDLHEGEYVFLEVTDTGHGMNEDTLARVFDPFFTTKFAGRGLGLAAVQGIVRSHHGYILVDSSPGQGTTFTVLLPPAEDDGEEEVTSSSVTEQPRIAALPSEAGGGVVLLMDDEPSVLTLARTAVERAGFGVLTATSGVEGLEIFRQHQAEIVAVLVDITMPGMTGLEVLKSLREADPQLPLMLMSGYTAASLESLTDLKLAGFVAKPFNISELAAAVQAAVEQRA